MTSHLCSRLLTPLIAFGLLAVAPLAGADSWSYPARRDDRVYSYGDTKIVLTVDGRKSRKSPDFILSIYEKGHLQSRLRNIWFEQIFPSPDRSMFVGLSNRGIPGTAVIIFGRQGAIGLLAMHGVAEFDYCEKSVSVVRRWYDDEKPEVTFQPEGERTGIAGITVRDCRGQTVDIGDAVFKAYNTSFQGTLRDKAAHRP